MGRCRRYGARLMTTFESEAALPRYLTPVRGNKGIVLTFLAYTLGLRRELMLALQLDHPPMAFAGEIALGLVLALFIGALVVAIADRASELSQLRETHRPAPTIVRRSVGQAC
jgi:hypothetical protein